MKELIVKWWFWVCMIPMVLGLLSFIVCMTYALHPMEIHIYANDEMVATSKEIVQMQRDVNFNGCLELCINNSDVNHPIAYPDCLKSCNEYYYSGDDIND
jgi:hypothetical protein